MKNSLIYTTMDEISRVTHYSDFIHLCHIDNGENCNTVVRENMLVHIFSGAVDFTVAGHVTRLRAGSTYLLRRNHRALKRAMTIDNEPMEGLFVYLTQQQMRHIAQQATLDLRGMKPWDDKKPFVVIDERPLLEQTFRSLRHYMTASEPPSERLFDIKMFELVFTVLEVQPELTPLVFGMDEPWKIDLLEFAERNYSSDLSLDDYAHLTGRSLSAFKKEFATLTGQPPMRWIIDRRLDEARRRIMQGGKPKDVYLEVGFKNLSHFSKIFKQKYGVSPSELRNCLDFIQ